MNRSGVSFEKYQIKELDELKKKKELHTLSAFQVLARTRRINPTTTTTWWQQQQQRLISARAEIDFLSIHSAAQMSSFDNCCVYVCDRVRPVCRRA